MNRRGFLKSLAALAGVPFLPLQFQDIKPKAPVVNWSKLKTESCKGDYKYFAARNIEAGQVVYIDSSGGLAPYEPGGSPIIGVSENAAEPGGAVRVVFRAEI